MSTDRAAVSADPFETFEHSLREAGPDVALTQLEALLSAQGEPRALLDAMLLKARHELGLPLVPLGGLAELPEPARTKYEDRYIEAIRTVGRLLLDRGDIPSAWVYFRAIAEKDPVAEALESYQPNPDEGEKLSQIIDVAFNQGAAPRRGFELILEHYGPCSAITAFEHLPADQDTRRQGAELLTRNLHEQLTQSLRADIKRRGQPLPPEGVSIAELVQGRDWLFEDEAYHIDTSHLAAVVRMSLLLEDPESIRLALDLTAYGQRLSPRYRSEGDPPFEQTYEDHAVYLRALLGEDVDEALGFFRDRLEPPDPDGDSSSGMLPAQVFVRLLSHLNRPDEAIEVAAAHLRTLPESMLMCPSFPQLCQRAGRLDLLAHHSRTGGDLVGYAAAVLQRT